jgi:hypothetical protein
MVSLPAVPTEPTTREVARPREYSLDFERAPVDVALVQLGNLLRELADEKIPNLRDLSCDLVVNPGGVCSLYFRAYR